MIRCAPLQDFPEKYNRCIELACDPAYLRAQREKARQRLEGQKTNEAITEGMETCDNGLRRCENLRNEPAAYWICMEKTCSSPILAEADPACERGKQACASRVEEYTRCVNLICKNPPGFNRACEAGKRQCVRPLRNYWNCVYKQCLGDTDQFIREARKQEPAKPRKRESQADEADREYAGDPIPGLPMSMADVPEGVSLEHYVLGTLPGRMLHKSPTAMLECMMPDAKLFCWSNDMSSCFCNDGTRPLRVRKKEYTVYEETFPHLSYNFWRPFMTLVNPRSAPQNVRALQELHKDAEKLLENIREAEAYLAKERRRKELRRRREVREREAQEQ